VYEASACKGPIYRRNLRGRPVAPRPLDGHIDGEVGNPAGPRLTLQVGLVLAHILIRKAGRGLVEPAVELLGDQPGNVDRGFAATGYKALASHLLSLIVVPTLSRG